MTRTAHNSAISVSGPDICGYSTKKVHVIFNYKGKNHLIKKDVKCKVMHFEFEEKFICLSVVSSCKI